MPPRQSKKDKKRYAKRKFMRLDAPLPKTKLVKLRYCDVIQLNPTTFDVIEEHRFRANSCYDPDRSGSGHQPRYFDQYAALYEAYEVLGSRISCKFDSSVSATPGAIVGVNRDNDTSTTYYTRSALMENPNSKYKVLAAKATKPVYMACNWSARKTFGPNYNRDDNEALVGANPSNVSDFVVWAINEYGSEDPAAINITVTIDYIVKFSERVEVAQS